MSKVDTHFITNAINNALEVSFNGKNFKEHLTTTENRTHKTIEAFQKCLAMKLSSHCNNCCQNCEKVNESNINETCEYSLYKDENKLYKDENKWNNIKDRADIRIGDIELSNNKYELIIEIDATRADQVAKKMMSRFCYASVINKPIVYVALLYQGTKSMNSDECKKYFKMGEEVLRKINPSNILIGYIVDKDKQEDVYDSQECNNSLIFNDDKAFDSDLYRRYLEDHSVQSPASIENYMLPHNKIYSSQLTKADRKKLLEFLLKNDVDNFRNNYGDIIDLKGKLTYWKKYRSYLNAKKVELGLNDEK